MKATGIINLVGAVIGLGKGLKNLIWVDGKFEIKRAAILLVALGMLILGVEYYGAANVEIALDLLDQFSDNIGQVEGE